MSDWVSKIEQGYIIRHNKTGREEIISSLYPKLVKTESGRYILKEDISRVYSPVLGQVRVINTRTKQVERVLRVFPKLVKLSINGYIQRSEFEQEYIMI